PPPLCGRGSAEADDRERPGQGSRLRLRLRALRRVDAYHARRLVAEDLIPVRDPCRRHDHVARPGVEGLVLDGPAHPARAHDDDVILRRLVDVHLLHLPDRMGHQVDLDVVEPHAFVLARRPRETAVVGLVRDLDHEASVWTGYELASVAGVPGLRSWSS